MYHTFFIHSFAAEYLGCIHVLAFVNSAAVNMGCMYLSKLEFLRGVGLLDRMAALFLVLFFFFSKIVYTTLPEKAMAPHFSTLAWKIPWTEEPAGCHLWGRTESDTTEVT